jgi:hypothetical protein
MNENDYNESLKYPLSHFKDVDPWVASESTKLLTHQIFEDVINSAILDSLRAADISFVVVPWNDDFDYLPIKISRQDLSLPNHQLIKYFVNPIVHNILREVKKNPVELSFNYCYTFLGVDFQLGFHVKD